MRILVLLVLTPILLFAQESTQTSEGVSGFKDKHGRDPVVSVGRQVTDGNVKLLVDAQVRDQDLARFPLQFDFYVNRNFLTSQIRSIELPGPIGVDVGPEIATPPFNFTVIASILHPSRTFRTVLNGAVFNRELSSSPRDCTVNFSDINYTNSSVPITQDSDSQFVVNFPADNETHGQLHATGVVNVGGGSLNAIIQISQSGDAVLLNTTGRLNNGSDITEGFSLGTSDSNLSISCN